MTIIIFYLQQSRDIGRPDQSCDPSAYEYLVYRISPTVGNLIKKIGKKVEKQENGNFMFNTDTMLGQLIDDMYNNAEDGIYFIIFSGIYQESYETMGHVMLVEKSGDNYCVVQT